MGRLKGIENRGNQGFTLVEVLAGIGISGAITLVTVGLVVVALRMYHDHQFKMAARSLRNEIYTDLNRDGVLNEVMNWPANSSSMACLLHNTDCPREWRPVDLAIPIYDQTGTKTGSRTLAFVKASGDGSKNGFTSSGQACTSFSESGETEDACSYQVLLEWHPICEASAPCVSPDVLLRARFLNHSSVPDRQRVDLQKLSFELPLHWRQSVAGPPPPAPGCNQEKVDCPDDEHATYPAQNGNGCTCYEDYPVVAPPGGAPLVSVPGSPTGSVYVFGIYEVTSYSHGGCEDMAKQGLNKDRYKVKYMTVDMQAIRPANTVTLILYAYEPTIWSISGNLNQINLIYLFGYHCQDIAGISPAKVRINDPTRILRDGSGNIDMEAFHDSTPAVFRPQINRLLTDKFSLNPLTDVIKIEYIYSSDAIGRRFVAD